MRRWSWLPWALLPWALGVLLLLPGPARAELRAGVAEADVTPQVGVPLAGYGGRLRQGLPDLNPFDYHVLFQPSTGVRDPIEAQALLLEDAGGLLCLLAIDAIGVEYLLLEDIATAARARGVPLAPEQLIVAASHTHSGPGALSRRWLWQLAATDRFSRRVQRAFVTAVADIIAEAHRGLRPARLAHTRREVRGLTRNRRVSRSTRVRSEDVDPRLGLLRVDAAEGQPLALVAHYAIHGTCLDDDNLAFSADVPGAIRREARRRLGYPVLFVQGCLGDVSPNPGGERGMQVVGQRLGAAIAELAGEPTAAEVGLQRVERWHRYDGLVLHPGLEEDGLLDKAPGELALSQVARALRQRDLRLREPFVTTRFRYTAVRLGSLVWLCLPGEPIVELGRLLEADARALGLAETWVLGLCNGHMGYLTTTAEYGEGGYEAFLTFYGADTEQVVRGHFRALMRRLAPF